MGSRGRHVALIVGSHLGPNPQHLPRDIVTFVIERELGLTDRFFEPRESGATQRKGLPARDGLRATPYKAGSLE